MFSFVDAAQTSYPCLLSSTDHIRGPGRGTLLAKPAVLDMCMIVLLALVAYGSRRNQLMTQCSTLPTCQRMQHSRTLTDLGRGLVQYGTDRT